MNYYEHHLGDYLRDTAHLSMLEDAAYRRLLDAYYIREKALPLDVRECCKLVRATSKQERDAVAYVLREFFREAEDGYRQKRADAEIARFQEKQAKAKRSAEARWSAKRTESESNATASPDAMRTHSEGNAPRARPQTPDTSLEPSVNQGGGDATSIAREAPPPAHPPSAFRMHADWRPSPNFASVCRNAGLSPPDGQDLAARVAEFVAFWLTQDRQRSQPEWDHALLKSLKSDQLRASGVPKNADRPRRADQLSATERNIRTIAGLTGRDREPERDPEHIDGTAVRVD